MHHLLSLWASLERAEHTPTHLAPLLAQGLPTVTISPLYASTASIRPSRYVPLSWIALPPNDAGAIDWLYDLGYRDALFWMAKERIEHTCSHVSRLSRFSKKRGTAAVSLGATLRAGVSALLEDSDTDSSSSSGSGSDIDDNISHGRRQTKRTPAVVTAAPVRPPKNRDASNDGAQGNEKNKHQSGLPPPPSSPRVSANRLGEESREESGEKRGSAGGRRGKEGEGQDQGQGQQKRTFYVRPSFALSTCHMRPRRERHAELDAPRFVPSLEKFVGHGSYYAAADFVFVVLFNIVWRPAAALILLADLVARLLVASSRGFAKDLHPLLWWLTPTLLLGGAALDRSPSRLEGLAVALGVVAAMFLGRGDAGGEEWREAGRCVRALVDFRRVLVRTLLPWAGGRGIGGGAGEDRVLVRSEALERSFMYRAVSFFM